MNRSTKPIFWVGVVLALAAFPALWTGEPLLFDLCLGLSCLFLVLYAWLSTK